MADGSKRSPGKRRPTVRKQGASARAAGKQRSRRAGAAAAASASRRTGLVLGAVVVAVIALVAVVLLAPKDQQASFFADPGQPRIAQGVHVGTVDLSGMTREQAVRAIDEGFDHSLDGATAVAFGSQADLDAAAAGSGNGQPAQGSIAAEQVAAGDVEGVVASSWTASAAELGARVDSESLATDALVASGYSPDENGEFVRNEDGPAATDPQGVLVLQPYCAFEGDALESFAAMLDQSLGSGCVETSVEVSDGGARAVEGTSGTRVDRGLLSLGLSFAFLDVYGTNAFVVEVENASPRIPLADAQRVAAEVTRALHGGAVFTCEGSSWKASASQLGEWVQVVAAENGSGAPTLQPRIAEEALAPQLVANLAASGQAAAAVDFSVADDGTVSVSVRGGAHYPDARQAAELLQETLFGQGGKAYCADGSDQAESPAQVEVDAEDAPENLTLDEAISSGLVEQISSFTTEFSTVPGTENRNHNIALACELLDNSVAEADGGRWSFNETAGNCNAERGFLDAGAIVDNEYVAEVGGGICQVATTVFNAVYEAGYPVVSRSNHSLYIASYPIGRDAAVSWPDLDFVWANDTGSDVLVRAESGTGYLTVSLYGVSPRYTVSTDTGEWQEGRKHDTRRERDDALAPGTSYVKTYGSDGSRISVVRTVYGPDGSVVRQDNFVSNYAPITEVIVEGPEAPDEPEPPKDQGSGNVESGEDSGQGSQSDGAQGGADAQQSSQG